MAARRPLPPRVARMRPSPTAYFHWDGTFESWSRQWVHKNHWRVRTLFPTKEDALQECGLLWTMVRNKYAATIDNPAWLMSLYKITVVREWHTYASKDTDMRNTSSYDPSDMAMLDTRSDYNAGELLASLAQLSEAAQKALTLLAVAPPELLAIIFADSSWEKIERRLQRLARIRNSGDAHVIAELREALAATAH